MHLFDEIDAGLEFDFDLHREPRVTTIEEVSLIASADEREWTREDWRAFHQHEYAGLPMEDDHPDVLVRDDAGEDPDPWGWHGGAEPIEVTAWQLASDRATLANLRRDWLGLYRSSPDGSRSVRGEHPFSTDEGSAEWLQRARIEMRFLYAEASSDTERAAIRAREAALRARHNARCWARAFARYHRLDEGDTLSMLNGWQKQNPIGWLGLEAAMKAMFESCRDDVRVARSKWEGEWRGEWAAPEFHEEREEWLAREPICPEYPEHLVSSAKKLRREERPVERSGELGHPVLSAEVRHRLAREAEAQVEAQERVRREAHRVRVSRGNVRRWFRDSETEWYAARKEWERAEMPDLDYVPGSNTERRLRDAGVTVEVVAAHYRELRLRAAA